MTADVDSAAPDTTEADAARQTRAHELFTELDDITAKLAAVPGLYQRRIDVFMELRSLTPPVPYADIAPHTDATAEAVRVAVNKKRRADAGNPITRTTTRNQRRQ